MFNLKYTSQTRPRLKNSCHNATLFFPKCVFVPFMEFLQPFASAPTGKTTPYLHSALSSINFISFCHFFWIGTRI